MASLKLTDITRATRLLDRLVQKSDINGDGAIRAGDVASIRGQRTPRAPLDDTYQLTVALDAFRRSAATQGGPTVENIRKLIGETRDKLREYDVDGDGTLAATERRSRMSVAERALLGFAEGCKNLGVRDFQFPAAREWTPPPFRWSGTPERVCQSLLDHCSKPSNDNRWSQWGTPTDGPRASRYVVDSDEAKAMVEALRPLYLSRQKAVLTEVARRTHASEYGCVSPTDSGKRVLQAFARELGLSLQFKQPAAPKQPNP